MTFVEIAKRAEKFAIDNSPAILTAIGITGTITTAVLTGKAAYKSCQVIEKEQFRENVHRDPAKGRHVLTTTEKCKLTWTLYIPAIGTGALTVAAIVGANQIGTRRAAAVAAAYSLSEKAFTEYKEKVVEKFGEAKEQGVRDEVAQDQVTRNPSTEREVIITGRGEVLCHDSYTGRYFFSDMETLKKAQNDLNYRILGDGYASLSDFYNLIGLSKTDFSDEIGWSSDKLLELQFSGTLSEDQKPCISINYNVAPVRDYLRFH